MPLICRLAAMDGMSNAAFRSVCFEYGADGASTEMVQALALSRLKRKSRVWLDALLARRPEEKSLFAQIIGNDPTVMAEAARRIDAMDKFDGVEINMGCPARCVVGSGNGSALLCNVPLAKDILRAVCDAARLPVILKMRLGWDADHITAPEIAQAAQDAGCAAIILHGRTRSDMYQNEVDLNAMREVRAAVHIPLYANGAVKSAADAAAFAAAVRADGVCIGRAALKAPWIFDDIRRLAAGEPVPERDANERIDLLLRFAGRLCEIKPERFAIEQMRSFSAWYLDGLTDSEAAFRQLLCDHTLAHYRRTLTEYLNRLIQKNDTRPHAHLMQYATLDTVDRA